jgi:hypothetical protein
LALPNRLPVVPDAGVDVEVVCGLAPLLEIFVSYGSQVTGEATLTPLSSATNQSQKNLEPQNGSTRLI